MLVFVSMFVFKQLPHAKAQLIGCKGMGLDNMELHDDIG